jgi:hypothetical protein
MNSKDHRTKSLPFHQLPRHSHALGLAYSINKSDSPPFLTETEFTKCVVQDAERQGTTFAKMFAAHDAQGFELRKAALACRDANWIKAAQQLMPTKPTYSDETASAVEDGGQAYQNLVELAQRMHDAAPEKSVAQHFQDIYENPASRDKARRELARARSRVPLDLLPGAPNPTPGLAKAYDQLLAKAEAPRKDQPELSEAQAFEKVYTAPANRELAKRERAEARASW